MRGSIRGGGFQVRLGLRFTVFRVGCFGLRSAYGVQGLGVVWGFPV